MTLFSDVENDPAYIKVLDKGFCGLVDHLGTDNSIVKAARVSYGSGTKSVREDRGLIRYLMRHKHTSPFEMCEVVLHIKCPIFVMRQIVRHRTASLNEYSGRYSVMTDEFYIPEIENIKQQSNNNKQGRAGDLSVTDSNAVQELIRSASNISYVNYESLLGHNDVASEHDIDLDSNFPGIARESARMVLPVNNYTELYWKQNLKNLMHLIQLRADPHAQWEIQEFARATYKLVQPLYPLAFEAFEDYQNQALTLSRMEKELLQEIINADNLSGNNLYSFTSTPAKYLKTKIDKAGGIKNFALNRGMSERELTEFIATWQLA